MPWFGPPEGTTAKDKVYASIFDQKGAMAALGIQGHKITKIEK